MMRRDVETAKVYTAVIFWKIVLQVCQVPLYRDLKPKKDHMLAVCLK